MSGKIQALDVLPKVPGEYSPRPNRRPLQRSRIMSIDGSLPVYIYNDHLTKFNKSCGQPTSIRIIQNPNDRITVAEYFNRKSSG
jgi:hypothetical protein